MLTSRSSPEELLSGTVRRPRFVEHEAMLVVEPLQTTRRDAVLDLDEWNFSARGNRLRPTAASLHFRRARHARRR